MDNFDANSLKDLLKDIKELLAARKNQKQTTPSATSTLSKNLEKSEELSKGVGGYQAPVKVQWFSSGGYSPGVATDKNHPQGHFGVDIRVPGGTPVYPIADGIVTNVGTDPKGGNVVNITYPNNVKSYYAHLASVSVHKGDKVTKDTVVGKTGDSGNAHGRSWPHIHVQTWKDGQIVNPNLFFAVPPYKPVDPNKEAMWLPGAQEQAKNWNMQEHLAKRKA